MVACGTAAALSGVFAASPMLIVFGLGWLIGGGAISSLEPREPAGAPPLEQRDGGDPAADEDARADEDRALADRPAAEDEREA
jgi:hypothetical protein